MNLDWIQIKYLPNTPVKILVGKQVLDGILLSEYDSKSNKNKMPRFKLPDGKILYGYECWWIPVNEIKNQKE